MKTNLYYTLFFSLLFLQAGINAQTLVTGTVLDATTGDPMVGVTIQEAETDKGTISDLDGHFEITVTSADPTLIFRYTGYATVEVKLDGRTTLDVKLEEQSEIFEELVVVGYGIQKKSDLTGAVSSVKGEDINRIATDNVEQALQGKVSGVYVAPTSGAPGAGAVIRIRGTGTLNNANPLFVIDGMITYDASTINPQDVESIEVLKDASAAAIYGSRGANGVIIITTKRGTIRDRAVISGSAYYGTQEISKHIDLLNAAEFASAYNDFRGQTYYPDPDALGEGTDWQDEIYRTAPIANYAVSANGGGEQFNYNFSLNYFDQDGIIKNSHFDKLTLRLNAEYKLNPHLSLGHNIAFTSAREQIAPDVVNSAYHMPPVFAEKDSLGNFSDPTFFGLAIANPAADLYYKSDNHNTRDRLFGNVYLDFTFLKDFTFRSNFGLDKNNREGRFFEPKFKVSASQLNLNDRLSVAKSSFDDWIWEQTLTYNHTWGEHQVTVLAGYTAQERTGENLSASRENFPGTAEDLLFLSAGNDTTQMNGEEAGDEAMTSNLYRINYTYRSKYMLTVSLRTDRSSRFIAANRTSNFPSASIGWNIGEEDFMRNFPWIDRLKVRASYGVLGNQASASQYPSSGAVSSGLYGIFGPDENLNQGATLTSLSNANLQWETSRQADIGVEAGFFGSQLEVEVDWYNRYTYDIIAAVPIPDYVGSQNDPVVNTAEVKNTGWDISANWRKIGGITYNVGAIFSPVTNKVEKLAKGKSEILAADLQGEFASRTVVGLPIGSFYGFQTDGIFQNQAELDAAPKLGGEGIGDIRFKDTNGDGVLDGDDRIYLGSPIPTLSYSLTAGLEWKGIDLNADVVGASGFKVYNAKETFRYAVYNWEGHVVDRWTPENPSLTEPRISNSAHNNRVSDRFLADGDFIRLRSITLGYTMPETIMSKTGINRLRFYITGTNVWTQQDYGGYTTEFPNASNAYQVGFDFGAYPVYKSWVGGVEINF